MTFLPAGIAVMLGFRYCSCFDFVEVTLGFVPNYLLILISCRISLWRFSLFLGMSLLLGLARVGLGVQILALVGNLLHHLGFRSYSRLGFPNWCDHLSTHCWNRVIRTRKLQAEAAAWPLSQETRLSHDGELGLRPSRSQTG
jgi:hypothetical protein